MTFYRIQPADRGLDRWDLDDLAAVGDLASEHGVRNSAVANWRTRHPDFPKPLTELSTGPVFSRRQVRAWRETRLGGRP